MAEAQRGDNKTARDKGRLKQKCSKIVKRTQKRLICVRNAGKMENEHKNVRFVAEAQRGDNKTYSDKGRLKQKRRKTVKRAQKRRICSLIAGKTAKRAQKHEF